VTLTAPLVASEIPFRATDGFACNLINVRRADRPPSRGPVLLVHGAGVRANIFRAPVATTLVDYLTDRGWDVWLENWRASIDLPPNEWTLDDAAVHDHPAAVKVVAEHTGASTVKAIIHCQGSTSFMMSAVAGLLPQVDCIVTNAVSLHTVVPTSAGLKIRFALPPVGLITKFINPQWGLRSPDLKSKLITALVRATHHECDNMVCKYASFTYGVGFPTLWRHENLNAATHEWLKGEFASVPLTFFKQMGRCIRAGHLVATRGYRSLPADFVSQEPQTGARIAFFAGEFNRCFLAESQRRTHAFFSRFRPNYHTLTVVPRYGHLDMFMGERAAQDVFPLIVAELER
jgi:hypothetical protein